MQARLNSNLTRSEGPLPVFNGKINQAVFATLKDLLNQQAVRYQPYLSDVHSVFGQDSVLLNEMRELIKKTKPDLDQFVASSAEKVLEMWSDKLLHATKAYLEGLKQDLSVKVATFQREGNLFIEHLLERTVP